MGAGIGLVPERAGGLELRGPLEGRASALLYHEAKPATTMMAAQGGGGTAVHRVPAVSFHRECGGDLRSW